MEQMADMNTKIWVISKGTMTAFDFSPFIENGQVSQAMGFSVSQLGFYLLSPTPISVYKKLIGCNVFFKKSAFENWWQRVPFFKKKKLKTKVNRQKAIIAAPQIDTSFVMDKKLKSHLEKINETLQPFSDDSDNLAKLEAENIEDITGIIEDFNGEQLALMLRGSVKEKLLYIKSFLNKEVKVLLDRAYMSNGLYELRGFDFKKFNSESVYRIIKFFDHGIAKAFVINSENKLEFWVSNLEFISQLQFIEQSISENPKFKESILCCIKGDAEPFRLLISSSLKVNYLKKHFPQVYLEFLKTHKITQTNEQVIKSSLNLNQLAVSFHYIPKEFELQKKVFVNITVLHDIKALEPIKDKIPELYLEINRKAFLSESGKYYLLDYFGGTANE
jgi:hypothetical protein